MTEHIIREQERRASIIDDICQQIVAKAARANADAPGSHRYAPTNFGAVRWSAEETRLLLAMRQEGVTRSAAARILGKSFKSVKNRLERIQ
jgi:transcriptional regulator with GAF, ATPase, and Fis domain